MNDLHLPILFSPINIAGMALKNRVVMAPMGTRYPSFAGEVTQRLIDYYVERAKGGVGLIIAHFASIRQDGISSQYPLGIWDDSFIPGLWQLTAAVHAAGARIGIQLAHAGGQTSYAFTGRPLVGPSPVPCVGRETPRELTHEEIAQLVQDFAQAARRAVDAGFDMVELHMAHGYLLNQFLSPRFNRRTDAYGGDLAGRARFPLEVVQRTRELVRDRVPIFCRLNVEDGIPGSLGPAEACQVAAMLERAGVATIDVSAGIGESFEVSSPPMSFAPGTLLPYAAAVKAAVKVPVVAVGKLHDPLMAESVLAQGKADLIAIGRGLIADPEWAMKAQEGRFEDIRPCLTCNRPECHGRVLRQLDMGCVVNPVVGREARFRLTTAKAARSVLIVGGGPAGMEAARVAALRGHHVTLCEQSDRLGGQLVLAATPPYKSDIAKLTRYLSTQMAKLGVQVRLSCRASAEMIKQSQPDIVVIATGAAPLTPPIPGAAAHAVTAWDVLSGAVRVGKRVVVIGGGDVGCETAEFLATQGCQVTVVEMLPDVATELAAWTRRLLLHRLMAAKVEILTQTTVKSIQPGLVSYDRQGLAGDIGPVDSVVLACGAVARNELGQELTGLSVPVHIIGDARRPRNAAEAIREGLELGFAL